MLTAKNVELSYVIHNFAFRKYLYIWSCMCRGLHGVATIINFTSVLIFVKNWNKATKQHKLYELTSAENGVKMLYASSSWSIYLPYFHNKLQTHIMQWQATRKTQSSTSWRPIINSSKYSTSQKYTMKQKKKRTNRQKTRQRATRGIGCEIN